MRVLPILFNTDMVRAILDGRKTVTRRVVRPKYQGNEYNFQVVINKATGKRRIDTVDDEGLVCRAGINPPYNPEDIIYVRETWAFLPCIECMDEGSGCNKTPATYEDKDSVSEGCFVFRADHPRPEKVSWSPSIHMPKEAARIWLKVTDVRVERLQDITGKEILAEGVANWQSNPAMGKRWENMQKMKFEKLWNSTIKKSDSALYGWEANPWVWVIEFERCEKPEDVRK